MPQSPVFVPQSPITVSKFFEALDPPPNEAPEAQIRSLVSSAPHLASCGECGLFEFEKGLQCRDCDQQWLACKVWYRAQDGGRRRWLTAPYIRPGESNARNRALMHEVGVPGCYADMPGADDATSTDVVSVRRLPRLQRARRFVRAKAIRARGILRATVSSVSAKGNSRVSLGRKAFPPLRRSLKTTVTALGLARLWTTLAIARRSHAHDKSDIHGTCSDTVGCCAAHPNSPLAVLRGATERSPRSGSGWLNGAYLAQAGGSLGLGWLVPLL
ncbi:uncharacterized protein PHACADRAFT_248612 [Phanerochaete carnosa HHB-10118-sp]|uniref:Uncharacterized protein n=1 Tax=Phanerochaete carnosa (strain HHB-10118-sp) TaxID=650164 RepID=K5WQL6_PHACS|nr:uncharacterized protein PHACADRAFT_248612 [Phanerochaete carnosa HHB-10118-sp]EKM61770.1 hypothetical protein PHACADRAFT_248612 [Phanerochaete carnosa HHB-10118-sp]